MTKLRVVLLTHARLLYTYRFWKSFTAEILNNKNEVLARSTGIFIAIDPAQMFAKYVDR